MIDQHTLLVYLVDDHEIARRGVARLLESDSEINAVGQVGSAGVRGRSPLARRSDVAIIDISFPECGPASDLEWTDGDQESEPWGGDRLVGRSRR